jgi:hypothetical protein
VLRGHTYIVRVLGQQAVLSLLSLSLTTAEVVADLGEALLDCWRVSSVPEVCLGLGQRTFVGSLVSHDVLMLVVSSRER